jgi:beta-glucanase (GH16 family)
MALVIAGRVKEATTTTGTGAYTVAGAVSATWKSFGSRMAVGDQAYCIVEAVDGNGNPTGDWEEGLYTYSGANTLTRTEVHSSSNGDAPVNWAVGTKHVYISLTARQLRQLWPGSIGGTTPTPAPPPGNTVPPPSPGEPRPVGQNSTLYGSLLFRDEFDGSALDTAKWNTAIWYADTAERNAPINFNVSNSCLNIWPLTDNGGVFRNRTIDTDGKYYQKYGFFEIRAKLCRGKGTWPAFWLFGHPGAFRPEIDVMEAYPGSAAPDWSTGSPSWAPTDFDVSFHTRTPTLIDHKRLSTSGLPWGGRLDTDFHTYGLHWDSTKCQMYFDGQLLYQLNTTEYNDFDLYLMLDLWYGGESGSPDGSTPQGIGNSYSIDYIRTWSLASGGGSTTPAPGPGNSTVILNYYGDSCVWGYQSGTGNRVTTPTPAVVQAAFPTYTIRNKGFNSVSSKEMFEDSGDMQNFPGEGFWEGQMQQIDATHVIIQFMLNDAYESRPSADYNYYISNMIQQARAYGRKPILVTPNPVSNANLTPYLTVMRDLAVSLSCPIIDVHAWALGHLASNGISMATWVPDGTHPSDQAYIDIGNYVASQLPTKLA